MLIALLATAAAQDTRIEVSLDDGGVGGPITFAADAVRVDEIREVQLSGGGPGPGTGQRDLEALVVHAPLTDAFPVAFATFSTRSFLPGMTVQVFEPSPTGSEQLLYAYQLDTVRMNAHDVSVTESAPRVEMSFETLCLVVTSYAYDALGNQTQSTTSGWSYAMNAPCTIP
jgi:hypothetical protein